jgi:hypothetical protein
VTRSQSIDMPTIRPGVDGAISHVAPYLDNVIEDAARDRVKRLRVMTPDIETCAAVISAMRRWDVPQARQVDQHSTTFVVPSLDYDDRQVKVIVYLPGAVFIPFDEGA